MANPADDLIDSIKGLVTGDNFRKSVSDAWDRWTGGKPADGDGMQQTKQPDDPRLARANKSLQDSVLADEQQKADLSKTKALGSRKRVTRRMPAAAQKGSKSF
jgi:hypothetical protein